MSDEDKNKTARDFTKERGQSIRVADWREDGLWIIILCRGGINFCTYVGLPIDHPLSGHNYDDLPIDCHGGLTFAGAGDGKYRPEGYYWYGWDYAHTGDYTYYSDEYSTIEIDEKDWKLGEIKEDSWNAIYDFIKLKTLAESIYSKTKEQK